MLSAVISESLTLLSVNEGSASLLDDDLQMQFGHVTYVTQQTPFQRAYAPLPKPTGELIQEYCGFELPTIMGPLAWRLFYASNHNTQDRDWGYGRRPSWPNQYFIQQTGNTYNHETIATIVLERDDGQEITYVNPVFGQNESVFRSITPRIFDTMDGYNEFRMDTYSSYHYVLDGFTPTVPYCRGTMAYFSVPSGDDSHTFHTKFFYSRPTYIDIQEPGGRCITYNYDLNGHVSTVEDWAQRVHTLVYDGNGNLTQIQAPSGDQTTYGYDANHLLTQIIAPNGFSTTYAYDAQNRVIARSVGGSIARYAYNTGQVVYTDPMGRVWTTLLDINGNITQATNPVGAVYQAIYDEFGSPTTLQYPLGHLTTIAYLKQFAFDPQTYQPLTTINWEKMWTRTDPLGHVETRNYLTYQFNQYDPTTYIYIQKMSTYQDALGRITTYVYPSSPDYFYFIPATQLINPLGLTYTYGSRSIYFNYLWQARDYIFTPRNFDLDSFVGLRG